MPDNKLRVILQADTSKFTNSLNKANKQMVNFGRSMTKVGKSLSIGLSVPLAAAGVKALTSAAKFEKLQTQLNVLTGSADKGAESFKRLVEFSAGTPFQLDQLVEANNTLMGFGVSAEDAFKHLQSIGDIAAVSGGDLKNISVAFGQVAASGRLMGQDLLQLINNGVPIIDMLSDSMGVAKSEIKDMVSEGAVTFPVLVKAFEDSTREGGKFAGGMQQLSGTLGGVFSTLKDNVNIAFAEIGKSIVESTDLVEVSKKLIARIQELTEKFKALSPETKKTLLVIGGIAAAIGPALILIGKLSIGFGAVARVLPIVATGFKLLTTAMLANPILAVAAAVTTLGVAVSRYSKKQRDARREEMVGGKSVIQLQQAIADEEQKLLDISNSKIKNKNQEARKVKRRIAIFQEQIEVLKQEKAATDEATTSTDEYSKALENLQTKLVTETPSPGAAGGRKPVKGVGAISTTGVQAVGADPVAQLAESVGNSNAELAAKLDVTKQTLAAKQTEMVVLAQQFNEQLAPIFEGGLEQLATGIGGALGEAMATGGNAVQGLAQVLLSGIGNMATQLGQLAIGTGIAIEGIKKALQSLNPVVAVAAGIALVALGSLVKAKAAAIGKGGGGGGGIPAFANGGIVSGPTLGLMGEYAGAKSNPEVIAPLNKLQGMIGDRQPQQVNVGGEFQLRGQDLIVALQRAEKQRGRIK
jgi:tape measure domain-containing protein